MSYTTQTDTALSAFALLLVGLAGGLLTAATVVHSFADAPLYVVLGGGGTAALVAAGACAALDERRAIRRHGGQA